MPKSKSKRSDYTNLPMALYLICSSVSRDASSETHLALPDFIIIVGIPRHAVRHASSSIVLIVDRYDRKGTVMVGVSEGNLASDDRAQTPKPQKGFSVVTFHCGTNYFTGMNVGHALQPMTFNLFIC